MDGWSIDVDASGVRVAGPRISFEVDAGEADSTSLRWGVFGRRLCRAGQKPERIRGMPRAVAQHVRASIARVAVDSELRAWVGRFDDLQAACEGGLAAGRWVPWDVRDAFLADRRSDFPTRLRKSNALATLSTHETEALDFSADDMAALVNATNEKVLRRELSAQRDFFASIESQPLTDEQARAVVTFDNRVQVLAAAGSGKTSVMVARAAYAVARGFVRPERILLLAFNKKAADELQERIEARFAAAGLDATGVRASTFHSFGLSVIGAATGRKPSLAPWVADGRELQKLSEIVDRLRDSNVAFRYKWDLYRIVYAAVSLDPAGGPADAYNRETRQSGFETLDGKIVRSEGERMIADWLFLNGVDYRYEHPYAVDVADATHRQYTPDFYYPDIDAWHEHWALGRNGKPPAEFQGYEDGMRWKRTLHEQHGTDLIETTFAEIVLGEGGFIGLEEALTSRGINLDWNPDRPMRREPVSHDQLVKLVRTFLSHVKSSRSTDGDLRDLLKTSRSELSGARTMTFLDLFWPIFDAWNEELRKGGFVDFDDMLGSAADSVADGFDPGYDLVLVDEFQDSSQARSQLVQELVAPPGRFLMAVGDDWQAINRFAGADLSVMTDFHQRFGPGPQLALTTTFRCTQTICDVATQFVSKNRRQFDKSMRALNQADRGSPVEVTHTDVPADAVAARLRRWSEEAGTDGASVYVLGRYNFERRDALPSEIPENLRVDFLTVHSAKGSEADYVVIPGMKSGTYGFPSTIADDPVLDLVMGEPDTFEHAEERRLLYVALTRARRGVHLVASPSRPSPFVTELLDEGSSGDGRLVVEVDGHGTHVPSTQRVRPCPQCNGGALVARTGGHGRFFGCSSFPACTYTTNDPIGGATTAAPPRRSAEATTPACPRCGRGTLRRRKGKFGPFMGCTEYPTCRYTRNV
ncbi:UvrD-helicase domain-containing protein [Acidimicrobiia bacterium EGI L10123]|uniref:UvrD-helicase domain-containing protein n=1 Tax=Salinilacustrithrix flava TaxID=2957203 RepID=UPI003D7C2C9F|nr:UvrD-helicase domain-containing protein [Acidimicrobiia bacterium EGI L10123]